MAEPDNAEAYVLMVAPDVACACRVIGYNDAGAADKGTQDFVKKNAAGHLRRVPVEEARRLLGNYAAWKKQPR